MKTETKTRMENRKRELEKRTGKENWKGEMARRTGKVSGRLHDEDQVIDYGPLP